MIQIYEIEFWTFPLKKKIVSWPIELQVGWLQGFVNALCQPGDVLGMTALAVFFRC